MRVFCLLLAALVAIAAAGDARACGSCAVPDGAIPTPTGSAQFVSGRTTSSCPSHFYAVELRAGWNVTFTTCMPGTGTYDTVLEVLRPGCTREVRNDDFCSLLSMARIPSVPVSGTWVLVVTGFATQTGSYEVAYSAQGEHAFADGCTNGIDDDGNGLADCADRACTDDPACPESCANGSDDDADDLVDCVDPECSDDADCPEDCVNETDDDANGLVDCADPDCAAFPDCVESLRCDDGRDNDLDGFADCLDADCSGGAACPRVVRAAAVSTLRVSRSGGDVVLSWAAPGSDVDGKSDRGISWRAWVGSSPDFIVGHETGLNRLDQNAGATTTVHRGAALDPGPRFYLVTGTGLSGRESNSRIAAVSTPRPVASWEPDGSIRLDWGPSEPAGRVAEYRVYRKRLVAGYEEMLRPGLATSVSLPGLDADVWHGFAVTAIDDLGNETDLSAEAWQAVHGRGRIDVLTDAPVRFLGPSPLLGWEPRAVVELPDADWVAGTAIVTLDSGLATPCDCAGAGHCGGDEMAQPVTVFVVMDERCADSDDTCLTWDRPQLPLLRALTPLGTDARTGPRVLEQDITPLREALRGSRMVGLRLPTWVGDGWRVSLSLRMSAHPDDASPSAPADGVIPVFAREGVSSDSQRWASPARVVIPPDARRVVARLWVSGHGAADAGGRPECTGPADEFCRKTTRLLVDGVVAWQGEPWRDCSAACAAWNACGASTCALARAGGCPGELTRLPGMTGDPDLDLSSFLPPGDHDVQFVIDDPSPGAEWGYGLSLQWSR